ncbi:hypothetical protein ACGRHY_28865 [Streptomyces sp. HK10]|uniref:hypothetical protein n=1 Tax=Streptomyces sp. HK10 TaxID=3373255 RepID=UPI003747FA7A
MQEEGEAGARALGLLRDAYRMLGDDRYQQRAEIADSCLRGAADALLKLPGAAPEGWKPIGLKGAARGLLKAVDAYTPPAPDAADGAGPASPGRRRRVRYPQAAWERIREAAEVMRQELENPGGYHRRRATNVAERVLEVKLGAAQHKALDMWGELYGSASTVLHGTGSDLDRAAGRYGRLLAAAREVFVPLPGRAEEVLALTGLEQPTRADAQTLSGWADPRATSYFFRSRPSAAWLELLDEVLLMPDTTSAEDHWPAAPYLDHLAAAAPDRARAWLAEHADRITAAGPAATATFLRLAARPGIGLNPQVRVAVADLTRRGRPGGAIDDWTLRLAADWALSIPLTGRDEDWIHTVQALRLAAVRGEHAATGWRRAPAGETGEMMPEDVTEPGEPAPARLPGYEVSRLLTELLRTAHPPASATGDAAATKAHPQVMTIRYAFARALEADARLTNAATWHIVFQEDLAEVSLADPSAFLGPLLARAVLDLAAADARAGVPLDERVQALDGPVGRADAYLHDRLLAGHLDQVPPAPGTADAAVWWERAAALVPALLAHRPTPEAARLVDRVLRTCPPESAAAVRAQAAAALGAPPTDQELAAWEPGGQHRPPHTWLRVWDWSPVLPTPVISAWEPTLARLRRAAPAGPDDPRTSTPLVAVIDEPEPAVGGEQAAAITADHGPEAAAAAALAAAPDAGAAGYLMVLRHLVEDDPQAWTETPASICAALRLPVLRAFYLAAIADHARRRAIPLAALPQAASEALSLSRSLHASESAGGGTTAEASDRRAGSAANDALDEALADRVALIDQALFDLLTAAWRADADLGPVLPTALDHLYDLTAPLTQTVSSPGGALPHGDDIQPSDIVGTDLAGRALQCLLAHARHRTPACGPGLPDRLRSHLETVVEATGHQGRTAAALGPYLPLLYDLAPDWVEGHRSVLLSLPTDRPSAASAWLRWGTMSWSPLLASLDRAELLARLREDTLPDAATHIAFALLDRRRLLGDPAELIAQVAGGDGGPAAVSRLLEVLAHHTARAADPDTTAAAVEVWRAAVGAGLPAGALAGAGAFAAADSLDDDTWLGLTLISARHTSALRGADQVARRAAHRPQDPRAAQIAAVLVARPSVDPWRDATVRDQARQLLAAAGRLPSTQRPVEALEELRGALITAGDIDAHRL